MQPVLVFAVIGVAGVAIAGIVMKGLHSIVVAASRERAQVADAEGVGEALRALEDHLDQLQRQVAELAERQDFAERLLAQARERGLPPGPAEH